MAVRRGGPRRGAGRPSSGSSRRRRIAVMLADGEAEELAARAQERGVPAGTLAYELLKKGLDAPAAEIGAPDRSREPARLTPAQSALQRAFAQRAPGLEPIYLGALATFADRANPESLTQAASSLRNLMTKLPEYFDVPQKERSRGVHDMLGSTADAWEKMLRNSSCRKGDGTWQGSIDGSLRRVLGRLGSFFEWYQSHRLNRKQEASAALREMDSADLDVPGPLHQLQVQTWDSLAGYFTRVLHHDPGATRSDFAAHLASLERMILDKLAPSTFANFDEIDSLIAEVESSA